MIGHDLLRLVSVPSISRHEDAACQVLIDLAAELGLQGRRDDVGNVVVEAGQGPLHVLFLGHIDTVEGDLPAEIRDDAVWGRGAVDAKGCLVAALHAMTDLPAGVRMTFVAAVGEETDSRGALGLEVERPDVIINGEPSGWDGITIGYKGLVRGRFECRTDPVHGGHPAPGAADRVVAWWNACRTPLQAGTGLDAVHMRLDALQTTRTAEDDIAAGRFQARLPPGTAPDAVETVLRDQADACGVAVHVEESMPAAASDQRSALVAAFRSAIRNAGGRPRVVSKTGTSDINVIIDRYDAPWVAYGPGDSALDHTADEHVAIDDLQRSVDVWRAALAQLATTMVPA